MAPTKPPTSEIQLHLKASGLKKADVFSASDPFATLILGEGGGLRPREIGRTEVIINSNDPHWTKCFTLEYNFENEQVLTVLIRDEDSKTSDDFLGQCTFKLASLLVAPGQIMTFSLTGPLGKRAKGTLTVSAEEAAYVQDYTKLSLAGLKLPNKDGLFGKSDPFYVLERVREDGSWVSVHKSEVIDNNLSPTWAPATLSVQILCNGDHSRPLRVSIYDYDKNGGHDFMCSLETSLAALMESQGQNLPLKDKKGKGAGHLVTKSVEFFKQPTFLDYIKGGCQINMVVAIDFTGSNGNPRQAGTLHYIDPTGAQPNAYEGAISALGNVLQEYDHDRKYPVYGFGGKLSAGGPVQHCFPIGPPGGGEVSGVQGILDAYRTAIASVGLSGPTLFTEVIQAAARRATSSSQNDQQYTVLVLLTDGVLNDMQSTTDAIVDASGLPLSIVIIGVGNADFSGMRALDADTQALVDSRGKQSLRDIVQFVQMNRFGSSDGSLAGALAKETLAEIPSQFVSAMKHLRITPNPAIEAPAEQVVVESNEKFEGLPSYEQATSVRE